MQGQEEITQQNKEDGQSLLKKSGLLKVLRKYGEVGVIKNNSTSKTTEEDINLRVVISSHSRRKISKIFKSIQKSTKFDSYYLGDWGGTTGGYQIVMDKFSKTGRKRVTVWIVSSRPKKKDIIPPKVSKNTLRFMKSLGALKISTLPLYILYALIIVVVFMFTLGSLNRGYNGKWDLKGVSGESRLIGSGENINQRTKKEIDAEGLMGEQVSTDSNREDKRQQNQEQTPKEAGEVSVENPSTISNTTPETVPDTSVQYSDISAPAKIYQDGSRKFVDPKLEKLEVVQVESPSEVLQKCEFNNNIHYGQRSDEVVQLQLFLKNQGIEIYPEGILSGLFGPLTYYAVVRFQEKYPKEILSPWGIDEGTGFVGKTTRGKIKELCVRG